MDLKGLLMAFIFVSNGFGIGMNLAQIGSEGDSISEASVSVGLYLTTIAGKELGVSLLDQVFEHQNEPHFEDKDDNLKLVVSLTSSLHKKVSEVTGLLGRLSSRVSTTLNVSSKHGDRPEFLSMPYTPIPQCCSSKRKVGGSVCKATQDTSTKADLEKRIVFTIKDGFEDNRRRSNLFNRQFLFGDNGRLHFESPPVELCVKAISESLTFRRRQIEKMIRNPGIKNVIIILDRGVELTANELNLGRQASLFILKSLSSNDQIGVVTLSNVAELVEEDFDCKLDHLVPATPDVKRLIEQHLNKIHHSNQMRSANPESGFSLALSMIEKSDSKQFEIIFISPWKNKDESQMLRLKKQSEKISTENLSISLTMVHLVQQQNSNKNASDIHLDTFTHFDNYLNVSSTSDFSQSFIKRVDNETRIGILPVDIDPVTRELVVTFAQSVTQQNVVIGVDIDYDKLFQDFVVFNGDSTRVMVLDKYTGILVIHPFIFDTVNKKASPKLGQVHFDQFESRDILPRITIESFGNATFQSRSYQWQHVDDTPFIVVASQERKSLEKIVEEKTLPSTVLKVPTQLFFHRLDTLPQKLWSKLCRHFTYPATLDSGSLYLSNYAFYDPLDRPKVLRSQNVESYLAYLTDKTNLISNPGIRPGIREAVLKIAQVTSEWKNMAIDSGRNNYIVRRYAATQNGVYYGYPGTPSPSDYEPSRQDWFIKAKTFPGGVVMTPPRLDKAGGGYIVSLAQAILNSNGVVASVVGMDLTLGYIYKLVLETLPLCRNKIIRCFIFDDQGFLIVHPDMFTIGEPLSREHLTYKEPLVSVDILRQTNFAKKHTCARYSDDTVQRYYSFNTSYNEVLSNTLKNGEESCTAYRVSRVHSSNLFMGIVETSLNCTQKSVAFCPCNPDDRWCILCQDKFEEENSCECPCQCSKDTTNSCSQSTTFSTEPVCPEEVQHPDSLSVLQRDVLLSPLLLPPCFEHDCGRRTSKEECFGIIGCSWCEMKIDEMDKKTTPLINPFCGESSRCFFGLLGGQSPYKTSRSEESDVSGGRSLLRDTSDGVPSDEFFFGQPTSSVGPIAGGIVGCFVFLAISVCCLRSQPKCSLLNGNTSRNDSSLHVSNLEEDNDAEFEQGEELQELSGPVDILRIRPASEALSPYQMNPTYRRPPPGTDSDHGYSTMTPLGGDLDSEIVPYMDSASARDRFRKRPFAVGPPSSLQSVTSGMSSRTSSPIQPIVAFRNAVAENSALLSDTSEDVGSNPSQTQLSKHQFIVSATVHMEAQ